MQTKATWDARVFRNGNHVTGIWLCIPQLPPSLNVWSRKHWSARHREVEALSDALRLLAAQYKIPCMERVEVRVVYYFGDNRRRDADNYVPKMINDSMRHANIIAEDNAGVLKLGAIEIEVDKEKPRTEVWLREWEDNPAPFCYVVGTAKVKKEG